MEDVANNNNNDGHDDEEDEWQERPEIAQLTWRNGETETSHVLLFLITVLGGGGSER